MPNIDFPSLSIERSGPIGWIQWKGTDVCMDVRCDCGELTHIDGSFTYHIKCAACGQVYECDGHITLHKLDHEPNRTQVTLGDLEYL